MIYRLVILSISLLVVGCVSTSNVLELGRDTYTVSATADGFRDAASARQSAFKAGAEKCNSLSKKFLL
jgi:outer membrane murein-binding lipoprotein Lpp